MTLVLGPLKYKNIAAELRIYVLSDIFVYFDVYMTFIRFMLNIYICLYEI